MDDRVTLSEPSVEPVVAQPEARTDAPVTPTAPPTEVVPLPEVLKRIRRDSREDPAAYLADTAVPYGGD